MGDATALVAAVEAYVDAFNRRDRDAWLSLFAPDALHEDPVGRPARRGRAAIGEFWDGVFARAETIEIEVDSVLVGGSEAVLVASIRSVQAERRDRLDVVDLFAFDPDGAITALRAFVRLRSRTPR